MKPHEIADIGLVRTFQRTSVFPNDTVYDNLLIGLHRQSRVGLSQAILGLPRARHVEREVRQRAAELAERVRSHVAGCSIVVGGSNVSVSLSLGVATGHAAAEADKLLRAADLALYQAKNAGRNRVEPSLGLSTKTATPTPNRDFWV